MPSLIFRKGLDMQQAVAGLLADSYHSALVERIKADDFVYRVGRLTIHLAREFGFCYGVDRAVDYAYQTRRRYPDRDVFLTGEIIHNPHVNQKLRAMGIRFLTDAEEEIDRLGPSDIVILPAFGVTVAMLVTESLEIGGMIRNAMRGRYGDAALPERYQAFDTICSATQDRQDAVVALLRDKPIDLMIVIGGYNSSNTANLARICAASGPTFHIADPECLQSIHEIRHRPVGSKVEATATAWLPLDGPLSIGLTSGASTPDNLVGSAIARLSEFCNPLSLASCQERAREM